MQMLKSGGASLGGARRKAVASDIVSAPCISIVGPVGCGKSTLAKQSAELAGLGPLIYFSGPELTDIKLAEIARVTPTYVRKHPFIVIDDADETPPGLYEKLAAALKSVHPVVPILMTSSLSDGNAKKRAVVMSLCENDVVYIYPCSISDATTILKKRPSAVSFDGDIRHFRESQRLRLAPDKDYGLSKAALQTAIIALGSLRTRTRASDVSKLLQARPRAIPLTLELAPALLNVEKVDAASRFATRSSDIAVLLADDETEFVADILSLEMQRHSFGGVVSIESLMQKIPKENDEDREENTMDKIVVTADGRTERWSVYKSIMDLPACLANNHSPP